jgi:arsenate reductase
LRRLGQARHHRAVVKVVLWHNPGCSKSRQARELLVEAGVAFDEVRYLETPPTEAELRRVLGLLGMTARQLARSGEAPYRELGLGEADEDKTLAALASHPILIERPIVIVEATDPSEGPPRAAVGRPPERVLEVVSAGVPQRGP